MQQARRANKGRHAADSTSRFKKYVAAGVAVVGAGAIAVNPVAPVDDTKNDAKIQSHDVALAAAAQPTAVWQQFFAETQLNLQLLGINASNSSNVLNAAFQNADLFGELTDIITLNASDPLPLITRVLNFQATYGDDIEIGLFGRDDDPTTTANETYAGVFERVQQAIEEFGPLLADLLTYDSPLDAAGNPTQGQFTNAAFEANNFFVLRILNALRPLSTATPAGVVPLLSIPGDFLGGGTGTDGGFETALPGFKVIDNVVNVFGEQGAARALVGPFLTAGFQIAQILDDTQAALNAGDNELAANELTNLPARVVNAFVNGFTPVFSPGEWPSLLSGATLLTGSNTAPGGLQYALVTQVNDFIRALGGTPPTLVTQPPTTAGAAQSNRAAAPTEETAALKTEPAPEVTTTETKGDTAELASSTSIPAAGGTDVATEGAEVKAPAKPVKKATSTWGTTTPNDVFKKVHSDITKTVNGIFGRKTESVKAEPTKAASTDDTDTKGGGTATDTEKSESTDNGGDE